MRVAQVAPLFESVPPRGYGGTERIVSYLTEELVRRGLDVTLFASGESRTNAKLVPVCGRPLRADGRSPHWLAPYVLMLERVCQQMARFDFDIVHFHVDFLQLPLVRRSPVASLTTMHGRLDIPEVLRLYQEFDEVGLVSISDAQRAPLPWANWLGTIHHGLPSDLYRPREAPGSYLAMVGRISPEKGVDRAIEIARCARLPLKIAAKVDPAEQPYFEEAIRPLLRASEVELVGEIDDEQKDELLGDALALLFPIDWPEPFGLVMIEAMACGTPVIAFPHGSVPELLEEGVTGFLVDGLDGAVGACERARTLDRRRCREEFERRFTVQRMAEGYIQLYQEQLARRASAERNPGVGR